MYVLSSGNMPFDQTESQSVVERLLSADPEVLEEVSPEFPSDLAELIRHLHAKDPSDRIRERCHP